ncbi:hypothetical protein EMCRGX_G022358 [Ephydatia muelleri]|eukprot:Em0009g1114a
MASEAELVFFVNGKEVRLSRPDPEMTLLYFLRKHLHLTGSKLGCGEGGCGACTVMVSRYDHLRCEIEHLSVNACLAPLCSVDGMAVTTVEGIGSTKGSLHPCQERIAKAHGSQCGFCTPGMVMSMYALLRNNCTPSEEELEEAFEGNLCRCTGYRPIVEGYKTFTKEACCGGPSRGGKCCLKGGFDEKAGDCQLTCDSQPGCTSAKCCLNGGCGLRGEEVPCCQGNGCTSGVKEETTPIQNGNQDAPLQIKAEKRKPNALFDSSKFIPLDPTQELIFPPSLMLAAPTRTLAIQGPRTKWFRPSTLEQLLELRDLYPQHSSPDKPQYRMVVGSSEIGVEVKLKNAFYEVLISPTQVPEMNRIEVTEEGLLVGGAVTLTKLGKKMKELVKSMPEHKTRSFAAILEMLRWFAGQQIRNVAAVSGNVATASPTSDLNPTFMALGVKLNLASKGHSRTVVVDDTFFTKYRQTIIQPNEVILSLVIPFTREGEYIFSYKQSRRRDDDITIVSCGLRVLLEQAGSDWKVVNCSLGYGGMSFRTVLAQKTQQMMVGRTWDEAMMVDACKLLLEDLPLAPGAPGGMGEYRHSLVTSFFFKFYMAVLHKLSPQTIPAGVQSVIQPYHRPHTRGTQGFQMVPDTQVPSDMVGRPMMHQSALKQATGEARYVDDMPPYQNELYAGLVMSTHAHAKIVVDTSPALKIEGVRDVVTVCDVPGKNLVGLFHDEPVYADGEVTCFGQIIAVVVADNQMLAQRAAKAVKVTYDDLPSVITIKDAIAAHQFYKVERVISDGDVEGALGVAEHTLEGETHMGGQDHFYLETHGCIAIPSGEEGEMELLCSTQGLHHTQLAAAEALGVPSNRIVARAKRLGGGFGGKETRTVSLTTAIAVAAHKVQVPVRSILERNEDMISTGGRHPFLGQYKVGFTNDGKITALDLKLYSNGGNSIDLSYGVMDRAVLHSDNAYRIPNFRCRGWVCRTNLASNTAFRGFGGPQGMMMVEQVIDMVATKLGKPVEEVRHINLYQERDATPYGCVLTECRLDRCWAELMERCQFNERKTNMEAFNKANRWLKRGMAVIPTKYGIAFGLKHLNQAGALVHIYTDGSILLTHGGVEIGQGLHTKMIQVCAHCLGVPAERVHILDTSTTTVANSSPTAASASTDLYGMAVKNACEQLNERLKKYKDANPHGGWEKWVIAAYLDQVNLSAQGFHRDEDLHFDWVTGKGSPYSYYTYGTACSEVEVDTLTGSFTVLRTDILMDLGNSINPAIDIGQVEGAFTQGLGLFTVEQHVYLEGNTYTQRGQMLSFGPSLYKIPGFSDVPVEFNVSLLDNAPNPRAIFSSKAVGEPPLFLAASVFFAIKEAIRAARRETGFPTSFLLDSPATVERIRMACLDEFTQKALEIHKGDNKTWTIIV